MSSISVSLRNYNEFVSENPIPDFILKGLPRRGLGMLIAPPDSGKSNLCLAMAYEVSTGINVVGVTPPEQPPSRVLYWPVEDGIHQAFERIQAHLRHLPEDTQQQIERNFSLYKSIGPILSASRNANQAEIIAARQSLDDLIEHAKEFDLLIIDTIREAIGTATEVEDDVRIKEALKELAQEANVAVLATHHPTKNVIRGLEGVSTASGSGLSCTIAYARCHFYLEAKSDKRTGEITHTLVQPKANFLATSHRVNQRLNWSNSGLLHSPNSNFIGQKTEHEYLEVDVDTSYENDLEESNTVPRVKPAAPRKQPKVIEATEDVLSIESRVLAEEERKKRSPISDELVEKFLKAKGKNSDRTS
ncbi:AAA family ATPase [Aliidiomarina quisquiliarum]|uniref:AAA family ATPase n=1 Tax=Aliidiomarina quisquiliarum TaxID=2938947 RepID=UPI00208DF148|nr:AAA family ATPase [Aliidiomarina quisquiliarum]MCO4320000.1 helicase RepA family protein [Aliidiomarina quisquiliarum]